MEELQDGSACLDDIDSPSVLRWKGNVSEVNETLDLFGLNDEISFDNL